MVDNHNMHTLYVCNCGFKTAIKDYADIHREVFENKPHTPLSKDRCPICGQRGELNNPVSPNELVCPSCDVIISVLRKYGKMKI